MKFEINVDQLRQYSIFVGTPMYGGHCDGLYCKSTNELSTICAKYQIPLKLYYLFNESLIQRARNYIVDEFLRSDATHLMFIDADIGFRASDVLSLLAIQTQNPEEYDIVVAPYPKKTIAWEKVHRAATEGRGDDNPFDLVNYSADYVFNTLPGTTHFRLDTPVQVSEAGTGFMLIPRTVFERYEAAFPEYKYLPDHGRTENFDGSRQIMAYFDCQIDPTTKRYLSEDYFFCRNAAKIGVKTHLCPWIELMHIGSYIYRGSMAHLASLGASFTADNKSNAKAYKKQPSASNEDSILSSKLNLSGDYQNTPVNVSMPKKKIIKGFRP